MTLPRFAAAHQKALPPGSPGLLRLKRFAKPAALRVRLGREVLGVTAPVSNAASGTGGLRMFAEKRGGGPLLGRKREELQTRTCRRA